MAKKINLAEGFNPQKIRNRTLFSAFMAGAFALVFIGLTFGFGLFFFRYTTMLPDTYQIGDSTKLINWSTLDGYSSLATFSIVVGGVVFAFINYMQNAIQRKREDAEASFNIYKEVYDRLMSPSALAARRWVIVNLPTIEDVGNDRKVWLNQVVVQVNKSPRGWKGERSPGKEYIKDILNTFDFIGFVAKHYWNMENEFIMWMSPSIAKVWQRIEVYVEEEATQRNEPDYYESARELGKHCVEWRQKQYPKSNIIKDGT